MSLEADIYTTLGPLVGSRVHPDLTPDSPVFPCIVYQQVGGVAFDYLEGSVPDKSHARVQVVVWSKTRLEASEIAHAARLLLVEGSMRAYTYAAPVSVYEPTLKLYGARTDYGLWYTPD